jgi:hypothetical protein
VLIVKPETVLRWHRHGWRTYWRRVHAAQRRALHRYRRPTLESSRHAQMGM